MSLSRSHLETCTTRGTSAVGSGPVAHEVNAALDASDQPVTRPVLRDAAWSPEISPTAARIAAPSSSASTWFFGANGSMDGGISCTISAGIQDGANASG